MPNESLNVMEKGLAPIQRVAICFPAAVIGALGVLLFSRVLLIWGLARHSA